MSEKDNSLVPFEWAIKDITQPTLKEIGLDLRDGYTNLKQIAQRAITKKTKDGISNKRVALEVLRNGATSESEICAEYFGGILASSVSADGKDDDGVYYLEIIKSLSSKQLHLHYVIYRSLNKMLVNLPEKHDVNVGLGTDFEPVGIWFSTIEFAQLGLNVETDLQAIYRAGLLSQYSTNAHDLEGNKKLPFVKANPTTLGVLLFAIAYNKLEQWRVYPKTDFGDFENIPIPQHYYSSLEEMISKTQ